MPPAVREWPGQDGQAAQAKKPKARKPKPPAVGAEGQPLAPAHPPPPPPPGASGTVRINATGRLARVLQRRQRGWVHLKLDDREGLDGPPGFERSMRTSEITELDARRRVAPLRHF